MRGTQVAPQTFSKFQSQIHVGGDHYTCLVMYSLGLGLTISARHRSARLPVIGFHHANQSLANI
jgi:hypothetical protein